uniref:Uncharacterized protein n=1 Tax=Crocodylus porosus TaxID=8502 RepID=A0A7M4E8S9_CROPO
MFYDFVIQNNCPISGTSGWVGLAEALGVQQSGGDWGSGVRSGEAGLKDRCSTVQGIKYEPQLLAEGEARLLQLETSGSQCFYNYLYRMKVLGTVRRKNFQAYLLELKNPSTPFKGICKTLVDTLLDRYQEALTELVNIIKA